jgi:ribonuclease HI
MNCFCDGSYNPQYKIAVIVWKCGDINIKHDVVRNTNNTRAELEALIRVLIDILKWKINGTIIINTDCQSAIKRIKSRTTLETSNFMTKKNTIIRNADNYIKIFKLIDLIPNNIEFKHIDGHIQKKLMNADNIIFSTVDKFARKQLREIINKI